MVQQQQQEILWSPTFLNIPITKGNSFNISANYVSGSVNRPNGTEYAVAFFGASDTINTQSNWARTDLAQNNTTVTAVCNYDYITRFWFYISEGVTFDNYKVKLQLEEGTTATKYDKYQESFTTNIYIDEPLRCIGSNCDYIDFSTKQIVRKIGKYVFNGEENILSYIADGIQQYYVGNIINADNTVLPLSTYFTGIKTDDRKNNYDTVYLVTSGTGIAFNVSKSYTIDTFTTWLKQQYNNGNSVKVKYVLAKPDVKTIELPTIYTLGGDATISVINDNGVSIPLQVSYYKMG